MSTPDSLAAPRGSDATTAFIVAVSVKLPEFWLDDPEMWFAQAEGTFRRANITVSAIKYDYVQMKLSLKASTSLREIVHAAASLTDPYECLKEKLTARYTKSRWRLVFKLFDHPDLGDRQPSEMMDSLLSLLPLVKKQGISSWASFCAACRQA